VIIFALVYFLIPQFTPTTYLPDSLPATVIEAEDGFKVTHVKTPRATKGIYMTQCIVASKNLRANLKKLIEETELNSVVIDIKDYSGRIGFETDNPKFAPIVSEQCYARDIKEFIGELHDSGIYVIGRITVFQDPYYTKLRPDLAIKKASDQTVVWQDRKGLSFIEVGAREFWNYIAELSEESYAQGFDELNFDYIRFPSDGNMKDIYYPFSEATVLANPKTGRADVLREFFAFLSNRLRPQGIKMSADLFGMTTTNSDDLNIGQILEYALPYFDAINPMVYPSHYPPYFNGYDNPNKYPYEVVKYSMDKAVARVKIFNDTVASTSPLVLKPWLQDFDYGGDYDIAEVKAQIKATYDSGLNSWLLWSPSNRYTSGALETIATSSSN